MAYAPAHLLAGGLLSEEVDEIVGAFAERFGLRERERRESGEWAAVWLSAAPDGARCRPRARSASARGGGAQPASGISVAARTIAR